MDLTEANLERLVTLLQRRHCPYRPIAIKPKYLYKAGIKLSTRHRTRTHANT